MDTPEQLPLKQMTEFAGMQSAESSSIVEQFAVSLMCWRMNLFMQDYQTYLKNLWKKQQTLLLKHMMSFPNNLPDIGDNDEFDEDEIYK
jgi:hypothetical protein